MSCFFLTLPVLAQKQQPDWDEVQVKIQKVSGNVHLLQGFGGNAAAFLGDDGIVLIDCEQVQLGPKIEAALKTVSDKPVKYVLDTTGMAITLAGMRISEIGHHHCPG